MPVGCADLVRVTPAATSDSQTIQTLCRRFSNLVGWPVKYAPAESERAAELEQWLLAPSDCCWAADVSDGQQRAGYLYIDLPPDSTADRSFLTVCGLAEVFAELLSAVAESRRSVESQTRDLSALAEMSRSPAAEADLFAALDRLLRGVLQLTGFRSAAFFLLQPGGTQLHLRALHALNPLPVPYSQRELRQDAPDFEALTRGSVLLHRDLSPAAARWIPEGAATAVCLPVRTDSGPIGTMWVYDRRRRIPSDRDFHVLESIAAQIAAVLERAVLLQESAVQHRLQRHLQMASEAQTRDINGPVAPDAGFEAAAVCTSRHELGGDLCELIPLDKTRTMVAVGDASGDSVPAAMVMSAVRGALRALALDEGRQPIAPEPTMRRLNRMLHSITLPHQFMSLVCGVLNTAERTFVYTNAGHPNPVLLRNGKASYLESHGLLLGVTADSTYQQSTLPLLPGDVLVLFSDGITEAMNSRQKMFRSDGVVEAIAGDTDRPAQEILQAVLSKLETHAGDSGEGDDRTLLVLKMR